MSHLNEAMCDLLLAGRGRKNCHRTKVILVIGNICLQEYFTETLPQILGSLEDLYKGNQVFWADIMKKSFNFERHLGKPLELPFTFHSLSLELFSNQ